MLFKARLLASPNSAPAWRRSGDLHMFYVVLPSGARSDPRNDPEPCGDRLTEGSPVVSDPWLRGRLPCSVFLPLSSALQAGSLSRYQAPGLWSVNFSPSPRCCVRTPTPGPGGVCLCAPDSQSANPSLSGLQCLVSLAPSLLLVSAPGWVSVVVAPGALRRRAGPSPAGRSGGRGPGGARARGGGWGAVLRQSLPGGGVGGGRHGRRSAPLREREGAARRRRLRWRQPRARGGGAGRGARSPLRPEAAQDRGRAREPRGAGSTAGARRPGHG